jgi:hypothetical protein
MPGRWEKIAAQRTAEEMEKFAYLRLITRALGVSHEVLADKLGFVRPFDAQEALRGRREHTADEIAIELLDLWRASRRKYLDAARYMDSLLADVQPGAGELCEVCRIPMTLDSYGTWACPSCGI